MAGCCSFIREEKAGATVEFVALMPAFFLLTFFIFEIIIAVLWVGTAEKAVQLGARLAVVSDYAVNGLTATSTNALAAGFFGQPCSAGACVAFTTQTCTGGTGAQCNATKFNAIVNRMSRISNLIQSQYVTISYTYVGLGYAGGQVVPRVTVTLGQTNPVGSSVPVPYGAVVTTVLGNFIKLGDKTASSPLVNLPTISVTLTGEDQSSAGA